MSETEASLKRPSIFNLSDLRLCWLISAILSLTVISWYGYQYRYFWSNHPRYAYNSQRNECHSNSMEDLIKIRLQESEVIWQNSVILRHKAELETPVPNDDPWTVAHYRMIWDFFYPSFNCPHNIERLGRVGDGGKWVCGMKQIQQIGNSCVIYSFGISGDTSFEQDILNRTNCSLYAYDYTVPEEKVPLMLKYPERATFLELGLGNENSEQLRTLKTEMDNRGHKFIDVLKVDIEGGEFNSFVQILKDFPNGLPFGQLLIEIHLKALPKNGLFQLLKIWWESLENAGLRPFHSEPNLYPLLSNKGRKPGFFEMSFLNVKVDHAVLHG